MSRTTFALTLAVALLASARASASETNGDSPARVPPASLHIVRGMAIGGLSTASLFRISSTAMRAGAGFGVERGRVFLPLILDVGLGQTSSGLGVGEITLGLGVQAIVGPFRLGGELDAGYAWLSRGPTSSLPRIGMMALDASALATVDLFAIGDRRAVFLGVKPSAGVRWGESFFAFDHGALVWRATALAGARF